MLIPSSAAQLVLQITSLSRRVNANSQHPFYAMCDICKLIKKGEC